MEKLYDYLPRELVTFLLVTVFSLLIGLSQRKISLKREGETTLFGTDRTFTFIGILGYLLYILDPTGYRLFMGGGAILGLLLGWLGWPQFVVGAFAAFFIGGAVSLMLLAVKKVDLHGGIPFGPFMLLGAWLGIFAGAPLVTLYLQCTGLA